MLVSIYALTIFGVGFRSPEQRIRSPRDFRALTGPSPDFRGSVRLTEAILLTSGGQSDLRRPSPDLEAFLQT